MRAQAGASQRNPFLFVWKHRRLIANTVRVDLRARYSGSLLGTYWALLGPMLLLAVYVLVYVVILRVRLPGRTGQGAAIEYTLVIFAGLVPWFGFSEGASASASSVVGNSHLVHNTAFPVPVLPVKAVIAGLAAQLVGLGLLMLGLLLTRHFSACWAFLPLALLVQFLFSCGIGWFLSAVTVFVRDMAQGLSTALLLLMFVSPIAYTEELARQSGFGWLLSINPLAYVIQLYRAPLVYGRVPDLTGLVVAVLVSVLTFWGGFRFFMRIRPYLADHV